MTFKTRKLMLGAATAVLMTTTTAWAQTSMGPAGTDKAMSKQEMMAAFIKADINKDGKLDIIEAENVPGLLARFKQVDTDGDGMVSRAEFEKAM
jgi:Ca2+-binding EF-hand superfamily protein